MKKLEKFVIVFYCFCIEEPVLFISPVIIYKLSFEEFEKQYAINPCDNQFERNIELINNTVLKEERKKTSSMPALEYLFRFLDAYDFASE